MADNYSKMLVEFPNFEHLLQFAQKKIKFYNQQLAAQKHRLLFKPVDAFNLDFMLSRGQLDNTVVITSNHMAGNTIHTRKYQEIGPDWYGIYHGAQVIKSSIPVEKKFNCFMNRMDSIRQSWLYLLIRRGVFDQGLISFRMDIGRHNVIDTPFFSAELSAQDVFTQQFQHYMPNFAHEHEFIKNQVPYKNFDGSLRQAIMQTEFSLVLETYFDCNTNISLSEKIFRCLILPRPWLLFAVKNAVAHLRQIGFDVLDDLVNHDYDNIDFEIDRQTALLDQVELLCQRTLTDSQIQRCEQAAAHNQLLLAQMHEKFELAIESACNNAVKKFSELD
jgi:hypothetical protein